MEIDELLKPGTYLEPFALRAVGITRESEKLIDQAQMSFNRMGLTWRAAQTDQLLRGI